MSQDRDFKLKQVQARKREFIEGLPHLYGWKWYSWAKAFYESRAKINVLTAPNQVSKSSTMIRKSIHWSTAKKLWPELWATTPRVFWYCYPSADVATIEVKKKWVPEFLPRGRFINHPEFGYELEFNKGSIEAIHYKTGVSTYFKFYSQRAVNLQTGTVWAWWVDEEPPVNLVNELMMRLSATAGYAHFGFTNTENMQQQFFYDVIEEKGPRERWPDAFKIQISKYDCLTYADGSPTPWTIERIKKEEEDCTTENEKLRRVHGRYVVDQSILKYGAYDPSRHFVDPKPVPEDWKIYAGVDIGSGGDSNHPAAITFVAVRPDYQKAYVFKGWRGDGITTTSEDVLKKYRELRGSMVVTMAFYDWHAVDFGTIASRVSEPFFKAEKSHEIGEGALKTLFSSNMIEIFDDEAGELGKLSHELRSLKKDTPKQSAKDDFIDSFRYAISKIPWDWSASVEDLEVLKQAIAKSRPETEAERQAREIKERREGFYAKKKDDWSEIEDEVEYWNDCYGS